MSSLEACAVDRRTRAVRHRVKTRSLTRALAVLSSYVFGRTVGRRAAEEPQRNDEIFLLLLRAPVRKNNHPPLPPTVTIDANRARGRQAIDRGRVDHVYARWSRCIEKIGFKRQGLLRRQPRNEVYASRGPVLRRGRAEKSSRFKFLVLLPFRNIKILCQEKNLKNNTTKTITSYTKTVMNL